VKRAGLDCSPSARKPDQPGAFRVCRVLLSLPQRQRHISAWIVGCMRSGDAGSARDRGLAIGKRPKFPSGAGLPLARRLRHV
jgi:hypothetical protein